MSLQKYTFFQTKIMCFKKLPHLIKIFCFQHLRVALIFEQLGVLQIAVVGDGQGERKSVNSAQNAATDKIIDEEGAGSMQHRRKAVGTFPVQVQNLSSTSAVITLGFAEHVADVFVAEMDNGR